MIETRMGGARFTRRGFLVSLGATGLAIGLAAQPRRSAASMVEERGEGITPTSGSPSEVTGR
jgi:hypothetical protein